MCFFFFQAEDGIRDLVRSRGLGDVYKRQVDTGGTFTDGVFRFEGRVVTTKVDTTPHDPVRCLSLIHI